MNAPFQLTPQAIDDLDAIWCFIAEDNREAAGRVEAEIVATCRRLTKRSPDGNQATRYNTLGGALLDSHEIP